MKTPRILAALLLAVPAAAWAEEDRILGRDDIEFAQELVRNRYPDLAQVLLARIQKAGKGNAPEATAAIRAIQFDLDQDAARQIEDLVKRKDELIKVLNAKEKFIEEFKGTRAAEDARNNLPDLYSLLGETFTAAIKKEKDEAVLEKIRAEGNQIFERGEGVLKARVEELNKADPRTDETESQLMAASYNLARTYYYHALIFAPGSGRRKELCQQAIKDFEEFDLSYSGTLLNFDGYIYVGQALKEIGSPDEADGAFKEAIRIRETFVEDPNDPPKVWPVGPEARDIICSAYYQRVQLRMEKKAFKEAADVAAEYLTTIPDPLDAWQAMWLLNARGEAQLAAGDIKGCGETAKLMNDTDPVGLGGRLARTLLEKCGGGDVSWLDRLRSAVQFLERNDYDKALATCRMVMAETEGTADATEAGCQAMLLMGVAYAKRTWWEESGFVYQLTVERFPRAKDAPEALVRAIDCYARANSITKRRYFKDRIDALKQRLVAEYPNDPRARDIMMMNAQQLEGEGDFLGANEILKTIDPASANYTKARLKIALNLFVHSGKLVQDKKIDEAKALYPQIEAEFKVAKKSIDQAMDKTLDPEIRKALEVQDYQSQVNLVRLYLMADVARFSDAAAMLDGMDKKWGTHPQYGPDIQNLKGRIFLAQGKFEEAMKWIDPMVTKDPKGAAGPASQLARALDEKAREIREKSPESMEADGYWRLAAKYYLVSVTPQIRGTASANTTELKEVGNRLFVYGLHFSGVPETRRSFVDWTPGSKKAPEYWQRAVEIYTASLAQFPDYQMQISLGRTLGFLQKWVDSAKTYFDLFQVESLLAPGGKRLDLAVMKAKPELVYAFLEWGYTERLAAAVDKDADRLKRAINIFGALTATLQVDKSPETWWPAKYHQLMCYFDLGKYEDAKLGLDDLERNVSPTFDGGPYQKLFENLREELKKKLFQK